VPGGPAYKRLETGDVLVHVNGEVSEVEASFCCVYLVMVYDECPVTKSGFLADLSLLKGIHWMGLVWKLILLEGFVMWKFIS